MLPPGAAGERLDKALTAQLPELSRARLQALMAEGMVSSDGAPVRDASAKAKAGAAYLVRIPALVSAEPAAQAIPLTVLYEDAHLIVIDKPAGMAAHPAPGTPDGTLVNALLHHCGASLSGIGGVARPGIVHRLDKDTSGVMVAAKTDAAHKGLSALFAEHDIERVYIALTRGAPEPAAGTIVTRIGRSPTDRKKTAVLKSGGREAITHYRTERAFGPAKRALAARIACTLETGRTHQIRVHLAHLGTPIAGDPLYGGTRRDRNLPLRPARPMLHAARLTFAHPISGRPLDFERPPHPDMLAVLAALQNVSGTSQGHKGLGDTQRAQS